MTFDISATWVNFSRMHNALTPFRKYSDFSGRASPREFWSFFALSAAVFVTAVVLTGVSAQTSAKATPTWALVYVFWWAVTAVPWFALLVRRLHDQGRSGWLVSINIAGYVALFIEPLAGMALLTISLGLMALRGEQGRNRYGEVADATLDTAGVSSGGDIETSGEQPPRDQHGVLRLSDGTFECAGMAFASYKEAYQFGLTEERRSTRQPGEADNGARGSVAIEGVYDPASKEQASENCASSMSAGVDKYEVTPTSDGRFMSGGYTFTTRAQAENYAQRRRGTATPSAVVGANGATASFPDNPTKPATYSGPKESWAEIEPGIKLGRDGQFYVRGYAHAKLDDARRAARLFLCLYMKNGET